MLTVCITNRGMDPHVTIELIGAYAVEGNHSDAMEATTDLLEWFSAGGYSVGTQEQRDAIAGYFADPTDAKLLAMGRLLE